MRNVAERCHPWNSWAVLKKLRTKLTQSIDELEGERLQDRLKDFDIQPISEAPTRVPVLIAGEIQGLQVVPRAGSPSLEVTISDGSGRAATVNG